VDVGDDVARGIHADASPIGKLARFAALVGNPRLRVSRTVVGMVAEQLPRFARRLAQARVQALELL
jgi:hypothetical protein